eukprot:365731-Chlamydomonas_euryale.AAC.5
MYACLDVNNAQHVQDRVADVEPAPEKGPALHANMQGDVGGQCVESPGSDGDLMTAMMRQFEEDLRRSRGFTSALNSPYLQYGPRAANRQGLWTQDTPGSNAIANSVSQLKWQSGCMPAAGRSGLRSVDSMSDVTSRVRFLHSAPRPPRPHRSKHYSNSFAVGGGRRKERCRLERRAMRCRFLNGGLKPVEGLMRKRRRAITLLRGQADSHPALPAEHA